MSEGVAIALITVGGGILTLLIKLLFEFFTLRKHINSRMDELLKISREKSRADGNREGREEQKKEDKK